MRNLGICIKSYVPHRTVPESSFLYLECEQRLFFSLHINIHVFINMKYPYRIFWTYKNRANESKNGAWAQECWSCACSDCPQWWEAGSQPLRFQTGGSPSSQLVDSFLQCVWLPENTFLVMLAVVGWAWLGPGAHQSRSLTPLIHYTGEKRHNEMLAGRDKDRERSLTNCCHEQNRPNLEREFI